jgi:Tfp pilus assembly protein PilV
MALALMAAASEAALMGRRGGEISTTGEYEMTDESNRAGNSESMLLGELDDQQLDAAAEHTKAPTMAATMAATKAATKADTTDTASTTLPVSTTDMVNCTADITNPDSWIVNTTSKNMCVHSQDLATGDSVASLCFDDNNSTNTEGPPEDDTMNGLDLMYTQTSRPGQCGTISKGKITGLMTENGKTEADSNTAAYFFPYCFALPLHVKDKVITWKHKIPNTNKMSASSVTISYLKMTVCKSILIGFSKHCKRVTKCAVRKKIYKCKVTSGMAQGVACDDDQLAAPSFVTYPAMPI